MKEIQMGKEYRREATVRYLGIQKFSADGRDVHVLEVEGKGILLFNPLHAQVRTAETCQGHVFQNPPAWIIRKDKKWGRWDSTFLGLGQAGLAGVAGLTYVKEDGAPVPAELPQFLDIVKEWGWEVEAEVQELFDRSKS